MESERTLVMVSLPVVSNPIEPHLPGTFVLGYLQGCQETAHTYLNNAKREKNNALLENGWLLPVGVSFVQVGSEERLPDPRQPRIRPKGQVRLDVQHAAIVIPLTRMDNSAGITWAVPITEKSVWVFPTGSMQTDLEAKIEHARNTLVENRSGLGIASANNNVKNLRDVTPLG